MSYGLEADEKWSYLIGLHAPDGRNIQCQMQLYSFERRLMQPLEGFAACFADIPVEDPNYTNSILCFAEKKATENVSRIHFMEIGNPTPGGQKFKKQVDIAFEPGQQDFPVLMQAINKYGLVFVITKLGFIYVYEISSANLIYRQRITESLIFASCRNPKTDGMICVNKNGQILSLNVDETNLIPFLINQCRNIPDNVGLAFKLAQRFHLKGADDLFVSQFNRLLASNDFAGAAKIARDAPGTLLRNKDTINKFKGLQSAQGPQPILIYFSTLLETSQLNEIESLDLVGPVLG